MKDIRIRLIDDPECEGIIIDWTTADIYGYSMALVLMDDDGTGWTPVIPWCDDEYEII